MSNMALVHLLQGRPSKSIEMASESVQLARTIFPSASQEYLEFVRMLLRIYVQVGKFDKADTLVEETNFSLQESCVLRAGIASITGNDEKALEYLLTAHRLRDMDETLETDVLDGSVQSGVSNVDTKSVGDSVASRRIAAEQLDDASVNSAATGTSAMKEFGPEELMAWDNGKKKEYQYRRHMLECLIDYNLSVIYAKLGNFECERYHIETAVDIMFRMMLKVEKESSQIAILQRSEGENSRTVFPPLDTTMAPHVVHSHCNVAKLMERLTHVPVLTSLKIQAGKGCSDDSEENAAVLSIVADLSAVLLPWENDPQMSNMVKLHEMQKTSSFVNPHKTNLAPTTVPAPTFDDGLAEALAVEEEQQMIGDTDNVDMQIARKTLNGVTQISDIVKLGRPSLEGSSQGGLNRSPSISIAASPSMSPRQSTGDGKKKKGKKDGKDTKKDKPQEKKKKSKAAVKVKSVSDIPTHGSIKAEMMPQCHPSRVEGATEVDKLIQWAITICHGPGYGFLLTNGSDMENLQDEEDGSAKLNEYRDILLDVKRQLLEAEASLSPIAEEISENALDRNMSGTRLSLYSTISNICLQLNHRKEAGVYVQKFSDVANALNYPHYQAIACRMQLDFEEWMSAPNISQMVSAQKLKRLQDVLAIAKEYHRYAEKCSSVDAELYYDSWKRLINVYTEISAIPDSPGAPKQPDTETLAESLALLTPEQIEENEKNDVNWLKTYSRIRAKAHASKMTSAIKATVNFSMKTLESFGG
mmetsp:Transcript_15606/g.23514  ORF Transcript_15606/g.23514 Transcript_15606/m.23514 type:complete len:757 (+) Transcript_15606:3-2273(+)